MKISITKGETTISIDKDDMDLTDLFDGFVYCLFGAGYEVSEIEEYMIKASEHIKNNHKANENPRII